MKVQDVQQIHSVQVIWHAKIGNVKIRAKIKCVPQTPIVYQPIIVPFVAVKKVTVDTRLPNAEENNLAHIIPIVKWIFRADKENVSIHALQSAIIVAIVES